MVLSSPEYFSTASCTGRFSSTAFIVIPTLIRGECEKALVALHRGNSTKVLRLIKDTCNRNKTSSIAYRVQGHIYMQLACVIEDTKCWCNLPWLEQRFSANLCLLSLESGET